MNKKLHVSDHALLRYMERGHGLDIDKMRQQLKEGVQKKLPPDYNGKVILKTDGLNFVVQNSVLVTVKS